MVVKITTPPIDQKKVAEFHRGIGKCVTIWSLIESLLCSVLLNLISPLETKRRHAPLKIKRRQALSGAFYSALAFDQKLRLEHTKISEGVIFRRLIGRDQIGEALHPGSVAPMFKRVAQWIGMPARFVTEVSGHSTRVGAAQDLAELDIDLAAITQAGGWKSTRMPLQYAEKINAARSGMARAAAASGRDEAVSE